MTAAGARLGRFELVSHLASGGMAKVYLAKVDGLAGFERFVVLKTLAAADIPDESYVGMFLDEARLAASLHHQNIAQVYEVGVTDETYFLAMEYVHGKTLRSMLEAMDACGRRLPFDFSLSVIAAAAAGLHHAHEARSSDGAQLSIVHRDVSPSNVLVGYDGATKLIDFGIAKAEARQTQTKTGFVKGKAGYMAPEQARGYDVDRRSDIFALGILAYELTTQHRAFDAPNEFERVEKIVHGDLTPPSRIVDNFPTDLEATLLTALSLDPDDRFQTADEFRLAIEQCARNHNITLGTAPVVKLLASLFGSPQAPWVSIPHQPATAQVRRIARGSMAPSAFLDSIPNSVEDEDSDSVTIPHDLQEPDDFELEIIAGRATPSPRLTPREPAIRDRLHPRAGTIKPVVAADSGKLMVQIPPRDEDKPTVVSSPTPALLATTDETINFDPPKARTTSSERNIIVAMTASPSERRSGVQPIAVARTSSRSSEQRAIAVKYADNAPIAETKRADSEALDATNMVEKADAPPPRVTREIVVERGTSVSELAVEFNRPSEPREERRSSEYSMTKRPSPMPAATASMSPSRSTRTHSADSVSLSSRLDVIASAARSSSGVPDPVGRPNMPAPRSIPERPVRFARSSSAPPDSKPADVATKTLFGVEPHHAPTRPSPTPRTRNPGAVPIVSTSNPFVATPVGEPEQRVAEPVVVAPAFGSRLLTAQRSKVRIHPLAIVIGVGLFVGLAVGLGLVVMTDKKAAPATVTPPPTPTVTPAPHASNVKMPAPSAVTFTNIGSSVDSHAMAVTPSADMITLTVTSTPKGATVVLDGERLGRTPFTTKIPREKKASWLKVRMTEHTAQRIQVQRAADITWDVSMKKLETDEAPDVATEPSP